MPSAFAYLPPASHALQFIVCYQQFTVMMFFSSLLISFPYSSVRVTSRDGRSLIFTKTFYIMLKTARIIQFDSLLFVVYTTQGYRAVSWIVLFSFSLEGAKTPLVHMYAYKSTAAVRPLWLQSSPPQAVANLSQSSRKRVCFRRFSLFVAFAF